MFDFEMPPLEWKDAYIPKKSGKLRHIKIPCDALKQVQKQILSYLYDLYFQKKLKVSYFANGFVPYRGTCTSMIKHPTTSKAFLCMDLKDFFDNFPIAPVKKALREAGLGPVLVDKILTACTCDGKFPQGSPTSPWLTNIGMFECDLMISAYAAAHHFKYTRYADDITLSLDPTEEPRRVHLKNEDGTESPFLVHNPYLDIFYGIETILKSHLGLKINHAKDHVVWRTGHCKPQILGITLRQDNMGYHGSKRLRMQTRAAVCNLAHKIRNARGRVKQEDRTAWQKIRASVEYLDYVKSFSMDGYNEADHCIQDKYLSYLLAKLEPKKKVIADGV